jgi:hypothetical protein
MNPAGIGQEVDVRAASRVRTGLPGLPDHRGTPRTVVSVEGTLRIGVLPGNASHQSVMPSMA